MMTMAEYYAQFKKLTLVPKLCHEKFVNSNCNTLNASELT